MPTVGWILEDAVERFWEGQPRPDPVNMDLREGTCDEASFGVASAVSIAVLDFRTGNTCQK